MEKQPDKYIICPNCKKTISNLSIFDDAEKGEGAFTQSIFCECGERITYWQITKQLKEQKTLGRRFMNWIQELAHGRA